jgi:hypothetical protein
MPARKTDWSRRAWQPMARNIGTGHRVCTEPGFRPIATRRYPAWWWPFELAARLEARMSRYLAPELRAGQEPDRDPAQP